MTYIHSLATALPPHRVTRDEAITRLQPVFEAAGEDPGLVAQVFENAGIDQRGLAKPQGFYLEHRGLTARNAAYGEVAVELGAEVARRALDEAGLRPEQVDLIIDTSCTGLMIPALDAHLVNALEMRRDVRRMPLTEVGCAAGAVALSRAREFLKGEPDGTVLIVCVELPSLTLQLADVSRANLVSAAIFGDGAAAAVVRATPPDRPGFELLAHQSALFPDTLDLMGFDLRTEGFHIVLSRRIPSLVRNHLRPEIDAFLAKHDHTLADLSFFVLHPGGTRVLDNLRAVLETTEERVAAARDVLRQCGNLSSASVLFVARETLDRGVAPPGSLGLMLAMGPGFAAEMHLLRAFTP